MLHDQLGCIGIFNEKVPVAKVLVTQDLLHLGADGFVVQIGRRKIRNRDAGSKGISRLRTNSSIESSYRISAITRSG